MARIESAMSVAAALLLLALSLLTLADVTGRGLFNAPIQGATEITELMLAGMSFLMYPLVARREQHIVVDLIDPVSGPVLTWLQQVLTNLIGIAVFGVISWRLWVLAGRSVGYGDATAALRIPVAPLYYGMAIFGAVTALVFLLLLMRTLAGRRAARHISDVTI